MRITKIIYQRLCTLYPRFETEAWVYSGMAVTTTLRIRGMKCRGKRKRQREKLFQASECGVARAKRSQQEKKSDGWALRGRYKRNKCKVFVSNCGKENSQCREIRLEAKIDNDVICCYNDSDVSLTLLITNSHLCLIRLW